jgi:hypothetical protein
MRRPSHGRSSPDRGNRQADICASEWWDGRFGGSDLRQTAHPAAAMRAITSSSIASAVALRLFSKNNHVSGSRYFPQACPGDTNSACADPTCDRRQVAASSGARPACQDYCRERVADVPCVRRVFQPSYSRDRDRILRHHVYRFQAATCAGTGRSIKRLPCAAAHKRLVAGPVILISPSDDVFDSNSVYKSLKEAERVCRSLGLDVQTRPGG